MDYQQILKDVSNNIRNMVFNEYYVFKAVG